jgi:hypothetical protein
MQCEGQTQALENTFRDLTIAAAVLMNLLTSLKKITGGEQCQIWILADPRKCARWEITNPEKTGRSVLDRGFDDGEVGLRGRAILA